MKTYPARFVGEFDDRDIFKAVPNVGDVALLRGRNYPDGFDRLAIRCACGDVDPIPLQPHPNGWTLTARDPVNIEPSVKVQIPGVTLCHYFVHGGQLQMLDDTTASLP